MTAVGKKCRRPVGDFATFGVDLRGRGRSAARRRHAKNLPGRPGPKQDDVVLVPRRAGRVLPLHVAKGDRRPTADVDLLQFERRRAFNEERNDAAVRDQNGNVTPSAPSTA